MRTSILFLSLAAVVSACSQDTQPTSPRRNAITGDGPSTSLGTLPTTDGIRVPDAKPTAPVAFTKVTLVWGQQFSVAAGEDGGGSVDCPAGSVPTGGGFEALGTVPFQPAATVWMSRPYPTVNPTGWEVAITNKVAGGSTSTVQPYVMCAS